MRVVHVSRQDYAGGAGRAATRLHLGLRALGVESEMIVGEQTSALPDVRQFALSQRLPRRLSQALFWRTVGRQHMMFQPPDGFEAFSTDRSAAGADLCDYFDGADLVNLHWIHDLFDYRPFFRRMRRRVPVLWTMHDMNAFTGGCHYTNGCERFAHQCGRCPQLRSADEQDQSRQIWRRKQAAYNSLPDSQLTIVTPSRWLAGECRRASLTSRFATRVIPNGVDLDKYQPRDPVPMRRIAGIPDSAFLVLVLAASFKSSRKGGRYSLELMERLAERADIHFFVVGDLPPETRHLPRTRTLVPISDDDLLSYVYSAADLFFIPSLQDNLPNTVMESIACGTPVVGFDVGGIPEMVRPGVSGELVPPGDIAASAAAIEGLAANSGQLDFLSRSARALAEREYTLTLQASRYRDLYEELLSPDREGGPL